MYIFHTVIYSSWKCLICPDTKLATNSAGHFLCVLRFPSLCCAISLHQCIKSAVTCCSLRFLFIGLRCLILQNIIEWSIRATEFLQKNTCTNIVGRRVQEYLQYYIWIQEWGCFKSKHFCQDAGSSIAVTEINYLIADCYCNWCTVCKRKKYFIIG